MNSDKTKNGEMDESEAEVSAYIRANNDYAERRISDADAYFILYDGVNDRGQRVLTRAEYFEDDDIVTIGNWIFDPDDDDYHYSWVDMPRAALRKLKQLDKALEALSPSADTPRDR